MSHFIIFRNRRSNFFFFIFSLRVFTITSCFHRPGSRFPNSLLRLMRRWPPQSSYLLRMLIECNVREMGILPKINIWGGIFGFSIVWFDSHAANYWLLIFPGPPRSSRLFYCCLSFSCCCNIRKWKYNVWSEDWTQLGIRFLLLKSCQACCQSKKLRLFFLSPCSSVNLSVSVCFQQTAFLPLKLGKLHLNFSPFFT